MINLLLIKKQNKNLIYKKLFKNKNKIFEKNNNNN